MDPYHAPHKANTGSRRNPPTTDAEKEDIVNPWLVREDPFLTEASKLPSPKLFTNTLTKWQWRVLVVGILAWRLTGSEFLTVLILILTSLEDTPTTRFSQTFPSANWNRKHRNDSESSDQTTTTTDTAAMAQNDKGPDLMAKGDTGQSAETKVETQASVNQAILNLFQELATKGSTGSAFAMPLHPLPAFKGKDVTEYLRNFNQQAELMNVDQKKKPGLFESYTDPEYKREVRQAMEGFNWDEAQEKLKEAFANEDSDQTETIEEKLEILNETRLKTDFHAIIKWLNEHQYLFKQTDKGWADSPAQSRAIYKALPEEIIDGICERHNKSVRDLTKMGYSDLSRMIKRYCENKIEIRKTHRPRSEDGTRKVTWAPTPPKSSSPTPKATKAPRILKKEPEEAMNAKIDDLAAQLTQLSINLAEGQKAQLQLAQIIQRENDRHAASVNSQHFHTNAVSIDHSREHENFYTNAAYGSRQGSSRNNMACWYCAGRNHFPDTCADLAYDRNEGIASYDSSGGAALLGRGDTMLPPTLVYLFRQFGVRKLVYNWLKRFPESELSPLAKRLEKHNKAGLRLEPTQPENNIIDDFFRKHPGAIELYRPKYRSPDGFDRLPTGVTRGDRDILDSQNPPQGTSTNVILVNEEPASFDQMDTPQVLTTTTVAVNANARKRVHVEDIAEAQEAAQPIRKATPTEKPMVADKEKNLRFQTLEEKQASILQELRDEYRTKKISIPADKLFTLLPQLGREVGEDCQDIANSVEQITYIEPAPYTVDGERRSSDQKANGTNTVRVGEQDWGEAYWTAVSKRAGVNAILINEETRTERSDDYTSELQPGDYIVTTDAGTAVEETRTVEVRQDEPRPEETTASARKDEEPNDQKVNTIELMVGNHGRAVAQSQELPRILVRLDNPEGKVVEAMVDTGSEGNIISQELAKACGLQIAPARASTTSFSQDRITMLGQTTVRLYLGNVWIQQRMYVAPSTGISIPFILGMPFVRSAKVSFDHSTKDGTMLLRCQLGNTRVVTPAAGSIKWEAPTYGVDKNVPLK
jgi:hypothetical protein